MTKITKPNEVEREWIVLDAAGKRFGRLLTEVATLLRGKHKPNVTPNGDCGAYVIIIHASKATIKPSKSFITAILDISVARRARNSASFWLINLKNCLS